jgi:hypothetical protein
MDGKGQSVMSEYYYRPGLAGDEDLRAAVSDMLTRQRYEVDPYPRLGDYHIDFVAWKADAPDHVVITLTAGEADLTAVGRILALLGRYREEQSANARAWLIAKAFTAGAWDAAKMCPDLTLKWYQVSVSLVDAQTGGKRVETRTEAQRPEREERT